MRIPIVIAAHDRPKSLERLLKSLVASAPPWGQELIIAIDGDNQEVNSLSRQFDWTCGLKTVIQDGQKRGLSEHIMYCLSLGLNYDGIILLEDDLWVSPAIWPYLNVTWHYINKQSTLAGSALYHQFYYPSNLLNRNYSGLSCYTSPFACSSGMVIPQVTIREFSEWVLKNGLTGKAGTPSYMHSWSDDRFVYGPNYGKDWKRSMTRFMLENERVQLYPPASVVTNFGDIGTHHSHDSIFFQSPLLTVEDCNKRLLDGIDSFDVYFNPTINSVRNYLGEYSNLDITIDLIGSIERHEVHTEFLISPRQCSNPIVQWANDLVPIERNIQYGLKGNGLSLGRAEHFNFKAMKKTYGWDRLFPPKSLGVLSRIWLSEVKRRFQSRF
jgi:hypothetical protein